MQFILMMLCICLSAIKIPICDREIELNWAYFTFTFGFAQTTIHNCQNTILNKYHKNDEDLA